MTTKVTRQKAVRRFKKHGLSERLSQVGIGKVVNRTDQHGSRFSDGAHYFTMPPVPLQDSAPPGAWLQNHPAARDVRSVLHRNRGFRIGSKGLSQN